MIELPAGNFFSLDVAVLHVLLVFFIKNIDMCCHGQAAEDKEEAELLDLDPGLPRRNASRAATADLSDEALTALIQQGSPAPLPAAQQVHATPPLKSCDLCKAGQASSSIPRGQQKFDVHQNNQTSTNGLHT